mgnify:CR=1 FL=1
MMNDCVRCPACGWVGERWESDQQFRLDDDANELPPVDLCPLCSDDVEVVTAGGDKRDF